MQSAESVLATIRCKASKAELDGILYAHGISAEEGRRQGEFQLVTRSRSSEPEVDAELAELALASLTQASLDGALPGVEVVANKRPGGRLH